MTRQRVIVCGLALLLGLAACGDDDDETAEATTSTTGAPLCPAVDDLQEDIDSLADLDVVEDGTNAVEANLRAIREDLADIGEAAPDTAPEESDAFDDALASLDDAVTAVGSGTLTADSARDVVAAVASTIEAGQDYLDALDEACP